MSIVVHGTQHIWPERPQASRVAETQDILLFCEEEEQTNEEPSEEEAELY